MQEFTTSFEILVLAEKQLLYKALVAQLKKDFGRVNVDLKIPENPIPEHLQAELHEKVYRLMLEQFPEYLNLLYIVDVPEHKVRQLEAIDVVDMAKTVSFLILKREWAKVSLRKQQGEWSS